MKNRLAALAAVSLFALNVTSVLAQSETQPTQPAPEAGSGQNGAANQESEAASQEQMAQSANSGTMDRADADMKAVLQQLMELGAKPIDQLSVEEARSQPTPADAVKGALEEQGKSTAPQAVGNVQDITIPGPAGEINARVYTPEGSGPFPVIVYFHGGGWVIANLDVYDATPRAMVNLTDAIVVSSHYRQGPEHKFPAAHEDAIAAYKWVVENAGQLNGDSSHVAVMGESAGGGLAAHAAIQAREQQLTQPVHMALIYPIAGTDTNTESYQENANAVPLNKGAMEWFFDKYLTQGDRDDPRVNLVEEADLSDLPPVTVVTAEIDPLRSEGQMLADKLEAAGVETQSRNFEGVTHEFFGMASVVEDAEAAQQFVADRLKQAFATN
ncbi:MAG TPA: alpha/beta hydrolase [Mesorhizobium sp.]|jgi:acetyl esterase/lipase|nr:alpha/beta hydrolase [Mesorhizobium sp.]